MVSSLAPRVPWPDTAPFNLAKAAQNTLTETLAFKVNQLLGRRCVPRRFHRDHLSC